MGACMKFSKFSKKNQWYTLGLVGLLSMSASAFAANTCVGGGISVSFDLSKTNNPSITNENTYLVVLGTNPATHKDTYVKFQNSKEIGKLVDITNTSVNGKDFGIPLSQLVTEPGKMAQVCITKLTSGRGYISFGNALDLPTENNLKPRHPNVKDPNTTTNGTLFDKFEFTYLPEGISYINPTGVDFIAIPYTIKQAGFEYGHSGSVEAVAKNMKSIVCKAAGENVNSTQCDARWKQSEWSSLVVYNANNELLRVDAPGRDGDKFNYYFSDYIQELSSYYSAATNRSIKVDLSELNKGTWSGRFIPNTKTIVFTQDGQAGSQQVVYNLQDVNSPKEAPEQRFYTSNSIFMGAQLPFGGGAVNDTIARDLTSAIVSGMLMRKEQAFIGKQFFDQEGNPVFRNKEQMQSLTEFYFNNGAGSVDYKVNQCGVKKDAPCINVYSEAVHALSTDQNIEQPQESFVNSYAFAYDDFLGMDGTNVQKDTEAATIVLGDMKGRKIPHIK
jgi:hypothetical protein